MSVYILKQNNRIISYGETPFIPSEGQTQHIIEMSFADYAKRFVLTANKTTIQADGLDAAVVTVYSNTQAETIGVLVNDLPLDISLEDGVGVLPAITAEVGGEIVIKSADETRYSAAGEGTLVIITTEETA